MKKIVKPCLSQVVWVITALASCFVGLDTYGMSFFAQLNKDILVPLSLIVGLAGFIAMIMLFIDEPEYCRIGK